MEFDMVPPAGQERQNQAVLMRALCLDFLSLARALRLLRRA
jgi:hypothetical protein